MAWALDDILPSIVNARDAGLTRSHIEKKLAKEFRGKLSETLTSLIDAKKIRGPIKIGRSQHYFASDRGPSAEAACELVSKLVLDSKTKLLSQKILTEKVTGKNKKFVLDGIKLAVESKKIIQLTYGTSKCYLHREAAQAHFALSDVSQSPAKPQPGSELSLQAVRPVFQRLKAEQGGLGTIDIYDLMKALGVSKDKLHQFLVKETKAGHLTIHPTTSVKVKPEVIDAGIRIPGFSEPFVTVALKDE
jgi:hypothetical protein